MDNLLNKEIAYQKIGQLVNDLEINHRVIQSYHEEEPKRKLIEPFLK